MDMSTIPEWLNALAWASLLLGVLSAAVIAWDLARGHRQHMWIMNVVWPLTALYSGLIGLWAYYRFGRLSSDAAHRNAQAHGDTPPAKAKPFWQTTAVAATHCGSGCTLGDLLSEWFVVLVPLSLFGERIFGTWALDYAVAFAFGIAFQYFTIKPMKQLSAGEGLKAAIKADTASLTAWQVGMYGWMAIVTFLIFGHELPKTGPLFWFMMQIGMLAGFLTSYPVNWWLIRQGVKERM